MAGGAANVACNLAQLGLHVRLIGVCGNDKAAKDLETEISGYPAIQFDPVRIKDRPTSLKTRYRAGGQQILRVDDEITIDIDDKNADLILKSAIAALEDADLMVISDYGKGFVTNELLELLRKKPSFTAVDPKPSRLLNYCNPDLLTPNRSEALELAGKSRQMKEPFPKEQITQEIFSKFSPIKLAITLGAEGMLLGENGKVENIIPTAAREVFDVSGAGDTVIALLAMGLVAGGDFVESAKLANLAAGIVVGKVGTAIATPDEIFNLL